MALSAAFRERLEHMEHTRNQRLSLLQAEKEVQENKSQALVLRVASMRTTEQRCLALDQKIASQSLKSWALRLKLEQGAATAVSTPALLHDKPVPFSWDQDNDNVKLSQGAATLPIPNLTTICTPARHYEMLGSFDWDQNNIDVKVYIYLKGADQEKIETGFTPSSFHIKFHDVKGMNYKFAIPELYKEIVPVNCRVITKPEKVVFNLAKASRDYWLDLKFKEERPMPNWDEEQDPLAGFMGLMKNMYEEGDPEMKRTVAKAWTEAKFGIN